MSVKYQNIDIFSGLLALNVTSNRVEDSYRLSVNFNRQELVLKGLPATDPGSVVNRKIDELLKVVDDCQVMILKLDVKTKEQWELNQGNIIRPDFMGSAATSLKDSGEQYAEKPGKGLKELIAGYETMAKNAPAFFNYYRFL